MLLIPCPWCGPRPEGEFVNLGEAVPPRPVDPAALADDVWVETLIMRANVRGPHVERWWHQRSCGRIFAIERDTLTHAIRPLDPEARP